MARSVDEIKQEIKTQIRTYSSLDNYLFPEDGGSMASTFNVIIAVVSMAMFTFEVLIDNLQATVLKTAEEAPSGNASWVRRQILNFQLGDQIQINTTDPDADDYFVPKYDPVNEANRIVTRAAVADGVNGFVNIKVAKGVFPALEPLLPAEISALRDYYFGTSTTQGIGFAGVGANFISLDADRLRVEANIYYLGQYVQADTKTNVISAINTFFEGFGDVNFGGKIFINSLVDAMQAVEGVSRVELISINGRPESIVFPGGISVSINGGVYVATAGYVIAEDETGNTLDDTLTMIEETA